ncbi:MULTISPECIES: DUF1192 domain-containing protein [Thalassospira]|jgi:uncharacterized small protein (DUF1192 family)|uniref:DUF1192 domain-containing protein n=1 Tax=Thalassospira lohafexi TaxID=744227 RepID=A0A2N3LCH9_9PROT|nr:MULTISPECIES: DUF1192 domain-containing protein [Thalassospira]PKR60456.1 hypothetical protein COO92_03745 [Thalassospira lohafexi]|tara:strand:+ start:2590 stop:2784 length:195 start_codon:yes stop_codon:yes gene_type:complete
MVVNEDDLVTAKAKEFGLPRNLEGMSVDSLHAYRTALEQEIANVEYALSHREGALAGAQALFKS